MPMREPLECSHATRHADPDTYQTRAAAPSCGATPRRTAQQDYGGRYGGRYGSLLRVTSTVTST
eukprot:5138677-Prymnesium_polylepis.1